MTPKIAINMNTNDCKDDHPDKGEIGDHKEPQPDQDGSHVDGLKEIMEASKALHEKIIEEVDGKAVVGGVIGMSAGEALGAAIGGGLGTVAGPLGVALGARVGGFAGSVLGSKLGYDAVHNPNSGTKDDIEPSSTTTVGTAMARSSGEKLGESLGRKGGECLGQVIGGMRGAGLAGALGERLGGALGEDAVSSDDSPSPSGQGEAETWRRPPSAEWMRQIAKDHASETIAATALGSIGGFFLGPTASALLEKAGVVAASHLDWRDHPKEINPQETDDPDLEN